MNIKSVATLLLMSWIVVAGASCGGGKPADTTGETSTTQETTTQKKGSEDASATDSAAQAGAKLVWEVSEGLAKPECAYYDADTNAIYVSNVNGFPTDKDGNGFISKISTDGTVIALRWALGLDAPKGLRAHGKTLWVADIDQIVAIDLDSGDVVKRVPVEGAEFLNDLATAEDGTVYAADTLGNKIFQYKDGAVSEFGAGVELESPNGLLVDGDRLIVAAWGLEPNENFQTKAPGNLYSLDRTSGKKTAITKKPLGNLDGVELDGQGGYVLTDFLAGKVLAVSADGAVAELHGTDAGAADHAYLIEKKLVVLPHMLSSKLFGIEVKQ